MTVKQWIHALVGQVPYLLAVKEALREVRRHEPEWLGEPYSGGVVPDAYIEAEERLRAAEKRMWVYRRRVGLPAPRKPDNLTR